MAAASVTVYPDAGRFLQASGDFLRASPAEHNLILSIAEALADGRPPVPGSEPAFLATVEDAGGQVVGAAFRTPPHKLGLTRMPPHAVGRLAESVRRRFDALPAVLGPQEPAEAFAREWADRTGATWSPGQAQRIYRLDRVAESGRPVPGHRRRGTDRDLPLVAEWCRGFADDLGAAFAAPPESQRRWIRDGALHVWEHGGPVSMSVGLGFTTGGARIGFVYTPPELRGRGYASALVADTSRFLLDSGQDFCMLYALVSNPSTNRIYRRIGFEPVAEVVDILFEAEG